jgi:hypothetical protein
MGIAFPGQLAGNLCDGSLETSPRFVARTGLVILCRCVSFQTADEFLVSGSAICVQAADPGLVAPGESTNVFTRVAENVVRAAFALGQFGYRLFFGLEHPGHGRVDGHASIRLGTHSMIVQDAEFVGYSYYYGASAAHTTAGIPYGPGLAAALHLEESELQ